MTARFKYLVGAETPDAFVTRYAETSQGEIEVRIWPAIDEDGELLEVPDFQELPPTQALEPARLTTRAVAALLQDRPLDDDEIRQILAAHELAAYEESQGL